MNSGPFPTPRGPSLIPHTHRFGITAKFSPDELVPPDQKDRQAAKKAEREALAGSAGQSAALPSATSDGAGSSRSVFSGVGVFTAWDATAAIGLKADWVAVQIDPEGDGRVSMFDNGIPWMARPTQMGVNEAVSRSLPFIGQAETQPELGKCLALDTTRLKHKALVGNPSAWTPEGFQAAADQGWELLLEWYWNAQPSYTAPDAHNYPLFTSVVFGMYDAADEQPGGRYVPLNEYRGVWRGNFAVYLAETLSPDDRKVLA